MTGPRDIGIEHGGVEDRNEYDERRELGERSESVAAATSAASRMRTP